MYELTQVGEKTYYIKSPTRVGVYRYSGNDVCLIDSGYDTNAAKKILKACEERGFNIKMIFITHVHADHVGGCNYLQSKTGCKIYYNGLDISFINNTLLQPSFVCGSYPVKDMHHKLFMAKPSFAEHYNDNDIPNGLTAFNINGHAGSMIGYKTSDDIYFLADELSDYEHICKHGIIYIFDIKTYLESLDFVETLNGKIFVMSHTEPVADIKELVKINRQMVFDTIDLIKKFCDSPIIFDDLLKLIFDNFGLIITIPQYNLIGSTIKGYLAYLYNNNEISYTAIDNKIYWQTVKGE